MKFTNVESAQFKGFKAKALLMLVMASLVAGCGVDNDDGDVVDTIALPTDDTAPLRLECENVGIYTESCVLDDPNNPYAGVIVSEDTKFELGADTPSATAAFYLWATALANGAGAPGENQFFVALNLQRLWAANNSENTRLQALKAYRSYLDNYFNSVTFFNIPVGSENFLPQSLNQFTGQMLFDATDADNTFTSANLFATSADGNKFFASQIVGLWGYYYDQDSQIFTKF